VRLVYGVAVTQSDRRTALAGARRATALVDPALAEAWRTPDPVE
jgi:hypothetical protein